MARPGNEPVRGTVDEPDTAPVTGERTVAVAAARGFTIEQILSGTLPAPVEYLQDHDEWVVVLAGGAVLEVDARRCELRAGDWLLLPAGTPHRLVTTKANTSWLAVRSGA
jgi:uncharacterized cupin superfamily protein